jgi:hypothetical protein
MHDKKQNLFIYIVSIIGLSLSLRIRNQLHIKNTKSNIKILHKNKVPKNSTILLKNIDVQITILHIAKTRTSLAISKCVQKYHKWTGMTWANIC